jgi:hypothetical protein
MLIALIAPPWLPVPPRGGDTKAGVELRAASSSS